MSKLKKLILAGVIGSVALTGNAQAACWTPAAVDAAKVRDLQSRLMVAALRCQKSKYNLLSDYNHFVRSKKPLLVGGNRLLRSHFAKGKNKKQAMRAYDRYAVSLANQYGAGSGDLSECKGMKKLAQSAANSDPQSSSLVKIATLNALSPALPGGRCGIAIASNKKP